MQIRGFKFMIESLHKFILFSKYLKWHWYSNQTDQSASVQYWIDLTHTRNHTGICRRITTIDIIYDSMYRVQYTEKIISYLHLKLMKLYNTNNNTKDNIVWKEERGPLICLPLFSWYFFSDAREVLCLLKYLWSYGGTFCRHFTNQVRKLAIMVH